MNEIIETRRGCVDLPAAPSEVPATSLIRALIHRVLWHRQKQLFKDKTAYIDRNLWI